MWPGTGSVRLGYGTVGGIVWDEEGRAVQARQSRLPRLHVASTSQLSEPVAPSWHGHPPNRQQLLGHMYSELGVGYMPVQLLSDLNFESMSVTSPATSDPLLGHRVTVDGEYVIYADDTYVRLVKADQIVRTLNMRSPVLQIAPGLVRTQQGVSLLRDHASHAEPLVEGLTIDASLDASRQSLVVLTPQGVVSLWDCGSGDCLWSCTLPKGSKGGWGRVYFATNGQILWCNRYEIGLLNPQSESGDMRSLLSFPDRQTEVHGLVPSTTSPETDFFILTSYHIMWMDVRAGRVVLSLEQPGAAKDYSLVLSVGRFQDNDLVTISSQLQPLTMVQTFGRVDYGLPASLCDPYLVETWPTQVIQSHCSVEMADDMALYSVGREGGLYKQVLTASSERHNATYPTPDTTPDPQGDWQHQRRDWDLSYPQPKALVLSLQNMYKYIYEMKRPELPASAPPQDSDILPLGLSLEELTRHCKSMWLSTASPETLCSRQAALDRITADMAAVPTPKLAMDLPQPELRKYSAEVLSKWKTDEDWTVEVPSHEMAFSQPLPASSSTSSSRPRTRALREGSASEQRRPAPSPSMSQSMSQSISQPMSQPMSQPVSLSQAPRKKKHKHKKRRTEGFV